MTALGRAAEAGTILTVFGAPAYLLGRWFGRRVRVSPQAAEMRQRFADTPMPQPVCRECGEFIRPGEDEEWYHQELPDRPHRADPGGAGL